MSQTLSTFLGSRWLRVFLSECCSQNLKDIYFEIKPSPFYSTLILLMTLIQMTGSLPQTTTKHNIKILNTLKGFRMEFAIKNLSKRSTFNNSWKEHRMKILLINSGAPLIKLPQNIKIKRSIKQTSSIKQCQVHFYWNLLKTENKARFHKLNQIFWMMELKEL